MREKFRPIEPVTEAASISRFLPDLNSIYGKEGTDRLTVYNNVQLMFGKNNGDGFASAWRITINPDKLTAAKSLLADFDDTLVGATNRKAKFYAACADLVPDDAREGLEQAAVAINNAARILPINGAKPVRYTPRLEMLGITEVVKILNKPAGEIEHIPADEQEARTFLKRFMQQPGKRNAEDTLAFSASNIEVKGKERDVFVEDDHRSASIYLQGERPQDIHPGVWGAFKTHMAGDNIPEEEFENFDLPEDVRFTIATAGQTDYQLPKIMSAIKVLRDRGSRLPDEIIVITRGRKKSILERLVDESPGTRFVYLDDNVNQLIELEDTDRLQRVHAYREGIRRAHHIVPDGVPSIPVAKTKHSEIIQACLPEAA